MREFLQKVYNEVDRKTIGEQGADDVADGEQASASLLQEAVVFDKMTEPCKYAHRTLARWKMNANVISRKRCPTSRTRSHKRYPEPDDLTFDVKHFISDRCTHCH